MLVIIQERIAALMLKVYIFKVSLLSVHYFLSLGNTTYPPVVTKDPANVTETFLFGSFNLTCQASGTVQRYNWLKDERRIDETSAVLIISDTVPEDRGYYTCVAENDAGNSTSEPGLVLIPGKEERAEVAECDSGRECEIYSLLLFCTGLYQYVAEIDAINNQQQVNNIDNITVAVRKSIIVKLLQCYHKFTVDGRMSQL